MALPLALAFPMLWAQSRTRLAATLVSAGYFLAASRGLPQGVSAYYASDLWPGLLLWIAASVSFVSVHACVWSRRRSGGIAWRYLLAALLLMVPPLGIVGWAHPVTAAGVLFAGWGWWGLALTVVALGLLTSRLWPAAAAAIAVVWLWSAATHAPLPSIDGWAGVDLKFGARLGRDPSLDYHVDLIRIVRRQVLKGDKLIVLPESALGYWTPSVETIWREALEGSDVTVVAGAVMLDPGGYDNVMVEISAAIAKVLYRERMPVPVSMWQPWLSWSGEGGGARAHFFSNPVVELAGRRVAMLVCYEQLLMWPVLQSMVDETDVVVATGNGWWATGTSIVPIQRANAASWARLFGVPLVMAFNSEN